MNLLEKLDRESDVLDELRNHLELVLEGFLGGPIDSAPVSKIITDPWYDQLVDEFLPKLNDAFVTFLSALLYALKTSLIDVQLIDDRTYDLSDAHERLKNVVNTLRNAVAVSVRSVPPRKDESEFVVKDALFDKTSLSYEHALAMSCINKVLLSSLLKDVNSRSSVADVKLADAGEYSYESTTSLTVFCDASHAERWWPPEKTEPVGETNESIEKDRLKKFCAGAGGGGIPFPEYGVDVVDCRWWHVDCAKPHVNVNNVNVNDDPATVTMTSTEWEDNWLFRRKTPDRMSAFNLESVQMVIPKPNDPATAITLGSLDIDVLSELSENNSTASLDFSSTESESDRPQVTGAVMKCLSQVTSTDSTRSQNRIIDESAGPNCSTVAPGKTIITVNGQLSSNHNIAIEQQAKENEEEGQRQQRGYNAIKQKDSIMAGPAPTASASSVKQQLAKPRSGLLAKATFDGKVVMENIEDMNHVQQVLKAAGDTKDLVDGQHQHKKHGQEYDDNVAYDQFSVMAFREDTLQNLDEHREFREIVDTSGTTNSLNSMSEEELDVHTSLCSTDVSLRRSSEGSSSFVVVVEPQPQSDADRQCSPLNREEKSVQSGGGGQNNERRPPRNGQNCATTNHPHGKKRLSTDSNNTDVGYGFSPNQKISSPSPKETTKTETITTPMSVSVSSGRGSTASTDSVSSVRSYELGQRDLASSSQLSEISFDNNRSISTEPALCVTPAHNIIADSQHQSTTTYSQTVARTPPSRQKNEISPKPQTTSFQRSRVDVNPSVDGDNGPTAAEFAVESQQQETLATEKGVEQDRDQDIYCVLPASKIQDRRRPPRTSTVSPESKELPASKRRAAVDREVEQRVERFCDSSSSSISISSNCRKENEATASVMSSSIVTRASSQSTPPKRNLLRITESKREVDIFASTAVESSRATVPVDTITVSKDRQTLTQVFPQQKPEGPRPDYPATGTTTTTAAEDLLGVVHLKSKNNLFGVQIYPATAPQPRQRRSSGGAEEAPETSRNVAAKLNRIQSFQTPPRDQIDVTSLRKTVIEQDIQDKLPNVKRLASRFRAPPRPGEFQSSTLPSAAKSRKEKARKQHEDVCRRLSQFSKFT